MTPPVTAPITAKVTTRMVIKRWAIRIHKWVALAVGLQIVLWVLGGVVMSAIPVSYTHLRAHETREDLVCRLLLEKKKTMI